MQQIKSNVGFLVRGENRSDQEKTSQSRVENQQTQSTYNRRIRKSNPGHIGGRRALSPLRQPFSQTDLLLRILELLPAFPLDVKVWYCTKFPA